MSNGELIAPAEAAAWHDARAADGEPWERPRAQATSARPRRAGAASGCGCSWASRPRCSRCSCHGLLRCAWTAARLVADSTMPWQLWLSTRRCWSPAASRCSWPRAPRAAAQRRVTRALLLAGGALRARPSSPGSCGPGRRSAAALGDAAGNPAARFFYLLTAMHGLHVIGGLVALGGRRCARRRRRAATCAQRTRAVRALLALPARRLAGAVRACWLFICERRTRLPMAHDAPSRCPRPRSRERAPATGRPTAQAFHVPWGKAMMWIFLLSDTFIFGCFLTGYMTVRISTTVPWPNPSEVFALHCRRARTCRCC